MNAGSASPRTAPAGAAPALPVAILGGGITGLAAAWELRSRGVDVVVLEAGARVGGAIGTHRDGSWLHELGPNSLLENSPDVTAFVERIGLGARRLYANPSARRRYIVRGGRLVAMPTSPLSFLTTRLFSWRAKLALLGEPWRDRGPADEEETVAEFVLRRLGGEFLDYAVNPFVGGVYAGDPKKLSVKHAFPKLHAIEQEHGSLLRGAWKRRNASGAPKGRMVSFPEGMQELPRALAAALGDSVWLHQHVRAVVRTAGGWEIEHEKFGVSQRLRCAAVVCALPAGALARLPFEGVPAARRLRGVGEIEHPAVVSVFTGFRREDVAHPLDGFGLLVPEVAGARVLGTLFSSTLFPGRAPDGCVGLTTFVGGVRQGAWAQLDDEEMRRVVMEELARLLGVRGAPAYVHVQRWSRAIPQYALGHGRHQAAIADVERETPGLFIGGSFRDGISVPACIAAGRRLAEAAMQKVSPLGLEPGSKGLRAR